MLNFQQRKKRYFDVTLHDGTELQIPPPTMDVFDAMREVSENPAEVDVGKLTELLAKVLRTNKTGMSITEEQIKEFDYDDLLVFFTDYLDFINRVLSDPNSKSPAAR